MLHDFRISKISAYMEFIIRRKISAFRESYINDQKFNFAISDNSKTFNFLRNC